MSTTTWRNELTEEARKDLITKMYHELSRVSGETDRSKIWSSAAKFELMLWNQSTDKNDYMTKLAKKIHSLTKKPSVDAPTSNTTAARGQNNPPTTAVQNPSFTANQFDQSGSAVTAGGGTQQFNNAAFNSSFPPVNAPLGQKTSQGQAQSQSGLSAGQQAQNKLQLIRQQIEQRQHMMTQWNQKMSQAGKTKADLLARQNDQTRQMGTQFHGQMQHMLLAQKQNNTITEVCKQQETQLKQNQSMQQQQLQGTLKSQQRQFMIQSQQIQLKLQTLQKQIALLKQQENEILQAHRQQAQAQHTQVQKAQAQQAQAQTQQAQAQQAQQAQAQQAKAQQTQMQQAQLQQAQMRSQQRTGSQQQASQQQLPHTSPNVQQQLQTSYMKKQMEIKEKYWEDLVMVYQEFTKLATQPKSENPTQQDKVKAFLNNLRRAMSVIAADPSKTDRNLQDLEKVEHHIVRVVQPIIAKLNSEKGKRKEAMEAEETKTTMTTTAAPEKSIKSSGKSIGPMPTAAKEYKNIRGNLAQRGNAVEQLKKCKIELVNTIKIVQSSIGSSKQVATAKAHKLSSMITRMELQLGKEAADAPPQLSPAQKLLVLVQNCEKNCPNILLEATDDFKVISQAIGFTLTESHP